MPGTVPDSGTVEGTSGEGTSNELSGRSVESEFRFWNNHQTATRTSSRGPGAPSSGPRPSLTAGRSGPGLILFRCWLPPTAEIPLRHSSSAPSPCARCGRCLPSLGPNCSWVSRFTANRLAAAPSLSRPGAFQGRHFPPEAPESRRSRPHSAGPQPLFLTTDNLTAARASVRQPSAAAIGPRRQGGAWSSAPPAATPDPTAVGCGLRQSRMGPPHPAGPARGWPRPAHPPAPPPLPR